MFWNNRWIVASQLETVEARKSFPCFDEPEWKATFEITLIHDKSLTAWSNMPIESEVDGDADTNFNWVKTKFEPTLKMSTYIVAIVLADYKCINSTVKGMEADIATSVCARPNAFDQLDYASNNSIKILRDLEDFYGVAYPWPKLDHVATPTFKYGKNVLFKIIDTNNSKTTKYYLQDNLIKFMSRC